MKKINPKIHKFLLIILFLMAFLERTAFDLGPNIELLTSAMVLATYFLGGSKSFCLTIIVIALSDRIIGNSKILIFTWSGFLIPTFVLPRLFNYLKSQNRNIRIKTILLTGAGVSSNLFFFLYTNFGVWLLDSWGMYTKDLPGIVKCYINGLPFLKNQIVSSLIFIPAGLLIIEFLTGLSLRYSTNSQKSPSNLLKY